MTDKECTPAGLVHEVVPIECQGDLNHGAWWWMKPISRSGNNADDERMMR